MRMINYAKIDAIVARSLLFFPVFFSVIAFFLLRKPVTNLIGKINKKEKKSVMITEQNNNNG